MSWIDRTEWKRRSDGVRFYKEVSLAGAIEHLESMQKHEADDLKFGVILSLTLYEPKSDQRLTQQGGPET